MLINKIICLTVEDVRHFVDAATRCDFDIDVACIGHNRYTVDAKSILGVMGLDLSRKLLVSYSGHDDAFEQYLTQHEAVEALAV